MPLYESRQNAENRIKVPKAVSNSLVIGSKAVLAEIIRLIRKQRRQSKRPVTVALEGWYGVPWKKIAAGLARAARAAGLTLELHDVNAVFKPLAEVRQYKRRYITDDPSFGYVNDHGTIADLMDRSKLQALKQQLRAAGREHRNDCAAIAVYGSGAAVPELGRAYDLMFYFDKTLQPLLWQMWDGELVPFATDEPDRSYGWKEYYYCDFYLLDRQKSYARERMDFYVEGIDFAELKMLPRASYDAMMCTLVGYPIKEVKIFQPGPWGAYRYRDLWDVPGLECSAWNELAGPELSMLVDIGQERAINLPVTNLLQYPQQFVGPHIHRTLPGMFPMDVWLDDGYFPKPMPAERISMPVHNHPSTGYVRRHFNEPLGRYETYYIAEAYEGANTWMGFKEDADLEEWEEKCRRSARTGKPIKDWKKYVANHASNVGDLYLIPPGTSHGHGGNQMVLEMDTVPSVAGTEYSFYMYDYCRNSWDDKTKTMTGRPVRMHLDHGFDVDEWRRENWVRRHLRARAKVVRWTKEYWMDRYSSYGPMPFEIERFFFKRRADNHTHGRWLNIVTLTVGDRVLIRSKQHPERQTEIECYQSAVVPACFGEYEFVNLNGGQCTVVQLRWKKG
jgi:hypothetical protein